MNRIQPQLWIERAGEAVRFYGEAFGARVLHLVGEGDEIVAQLAIGNDSCFWVAGADAVKGRSAQLPQSDRRILLVDDPEIVVVVCRRWRMRPPCRMTHRRLGRAVTSARVGDRAAAGHLAALSAADQAVRVGSAAILRWSLAPRSGAPG